MATATVPMARDTRLELTWRGFVLGAAITLVFTAANVYLGLKVGLTFATSIPAAVISMAVLRAFRNATICENNIVQTIASAAGTLSAIIFVLPGLVMVGWWTGFPYWESFAVCAIGGILGVMYSVPLRRALVDQSDLPYPEGVAAAEVLKVGVGSRDARWRVGRGEQAQACWRSSWARSRQPDTRACVATRIFTDELAAYFRARYAARPASACRCRSRLSARAISSGSLSASRSCGGSGHRVGHLDADPDRAASGGRPRRRFRA